MTEPEGAATEHGDETDVGGILDRTLDLVRFLRARCPWDAAQTPESLTPYLVEETLELSEAILDGGDEEEIRSELGDLLLNVAFQIVLAEERGAFGPEDVVRDTESKMRRRHPHLYGDADAPPNHWEATKAERRAAATFDDLVQRLDPLSRAHRIQDRAAGVGFDWDRVADAFRKVREEVDEVAVHLESGEAQQLELELGDLLFAVVNVARLADLHAATALKRSNAKFQRRFERLRSLAEARGLVMGEATLDELDELWDEVKDGESA